MTDEIQLAFELVKSGEPRRIHFNGEIDSILLREIEVRDKVGRTLLHAAVERGDVEIVDYVLHTAGLSPLSRDNENLTPLDLARKMEWVWDEEDKTYPAEIIRVLKAKTDLKRKELT